MKLKKYLCAFCVISLMAILLTVPAFAAGGDVAGAVAVSYTHLRAHETGRNLVCRLLLEKIFFFNDTATTEIYT